MKAVTGLVMVIIGVMILIDLMVSSKMSPEVWKFWVRTYMYLGGGLILISGFKMLISLDSKDEPPAVPAAPTEAKNKKTRKK